MRERKKKKKKCQGFYSFLHTLKLNCEEFMLLLMFCNFIRLSLLGNRIYYLESIDGKVDRNLINIQA